MFAINLGYRERKAYDRMASLFERFSKELKQTAVAREQYADRRFGSVANREEATELVLGAPMGCQAARPKVRSKNRT